MVDPLTAASKTSFSGNPENLVGGELVAAFRPDCFAFREIDRGA